MDVSKEIRSEHGSGHGSREWIEIAGGASGVLRPATPPHAEESLKFVWSSRF